MWCLAGLSQGLLTFLPAAAQAQLQRQISETLQRCRQALLIFDEAEKLHSSLLDAIRPFMVQQDSNGQQRPIFLFLR